MLRRHSNCTVDKCNTCLKDHDNLRKYLEEKTGITNKDVLGLYRNYLDKQGIISEGADGWGNQNAFDDTNIENFIKSVACGHEPEDTQFCSCPKPEEN